MRLNEVRWGRALVGALVAEVAQVAAAFAWVAFYSYVINRGQPFAVYEAHAQLSGPWVSIVAGFPIFYAASRYIARSVPTATALFAVFLVIDVAILLAMPDAGGAGLIVMAGASFVTKLVACLLGGRHAASHNTESGASATLLGSVTPPPSFPWRALAGLPSARESGQRR